MRRSDLFLIKIKELLAFTRNDKEGNYRRINVTAH